MPRIKPTTITFSCGHTQNVTIAKSDALDPADYVAWAEEHGLCDECKAKLEWAAKEAATMDERDMPLSAMVYEGPCYDHRFFIGFGGNSYPHKDKLKAMGCRFVCAYAQAERHVLMGDGVNQFARRDDWYRPSGGGGRWMKCLDVPEGAGITEAIAAAAKVAEQAGAELIVRRTPIEGAPSYPGMRYFPRGIRGGSSGEYI